MSYKIEDEIGQAVTKNNQKYADKSSQYLAQLRYRLRRLAAGVCLYPACKEPRVTQHCLKHMNSRNAYYRAKRAEKKTA